MKRILFIPNAAGVIPHLLPLIALSSKLDAARYESLFLAPSRLHAGMRRLGHQVVDIDYQPESIFRDELAACGRCRPDVIIDDFSLASLLVTKVTNKPRVSILRPGTFHRYRPRSTSHVHSYVSRSGQPFDFARHFANYSFLCGEPAPASFAEACVGDVGIVPGIRSIASSGNHDEAAFPLAYAGSLTVGDGEVPLYDGACVDEHISIDEFFRKNAARSKVFFTAGTIHRPGDESGKAIEHMLSKGVAVISTIAPATSVSDASRFLYVPFVPMHKICSQIDLMIHHCGSSYQYAIDHSVPSICFGTACYDRDDIAMRLDELGAARYIPPDQVSSEIFADIFDLCFDGHGAWNRRARRVLAGLRSEGERTASSFDLDGVIRLAVERNSSRSASKCSAGMSPSWAA